MFCSFLHNFLSKIADIKPIWVSGKNLNSGVVVIVYFRIVNIYMTTYFLTIYQQSFFQVSKLVTLLF